MAKKTEYIDNDNHKHYYEKGIKNDFVAIDHLSRSLVGMDFSNGLDKQIPYHPFPQTDKEIITVCDYTMDEHFSLGKNLTQLEKACADAIYTLWYRDNYHEKFSGVISKHEYTLIQIAQIVKGSDDRCNAEFLMAVSEAIRKIAATSVRLSCDAEMYLRYSQEKISKRVYDQLKECNIDIWTHLIPCSVRSVSEKKDPTHRMVLSVRVMEEPPLFKYALTSGKYEMVSQNKFHFPEQMKITKQRVTLRNYLRERILIMKRSNVSRVIRYDTLFQTVIGKAEEECSYTEKSRLTNDIKEMLGKFADEWILDKDKPFTVMKEKTARRSKEVGVKVNFL